MPNAAEVASPAIVLWPNGATEILRGLISDGKTSLQAAKFLSAYFNRRFTKNAVIGRCWRLGILRPAYRISWETVEQVRVARGTNAVIGRQFGVSARWVGAVRNGLTRVKREFPPALPTPNPFPKPGHCLWGLGDPGSPDFRFCGDEAAGESFCAAHRALAYFRPAQAA